MTKILSSSFPQAGRRGGSVSSESQLSSIDGRRSGDGGADLAAENADLKRQVTRQTGRSRMAALAAMCGLGGL